MARIRWPYPFYILENTIYGSYQMYMSRYDFIFKLITSGLAKSSPKVRRPISMVSKYTSKSDVRTRHDNPGRR